MLQVINNKVYCETKDIEGINPGTLKSNLLRGRRSGGEWRNIPNPAFNNTNSRRLIEVSGLPAVYREQVLARFALSVADLEAGLKEAAKKEDTDVIRIVNEAVHKVVKVGEGFVRDVLKDYLDKHWGDYSARFIEQGLDTKRVRLYARTCALVRKIWDEAAPIEDILEHTEYKRLRRTLVLNLMNALQAPLEVLVPRSEYRLTEWIDKVLKALHTRQDIYTLVLCKHMSNSNAVKFTAVQKKVANGLRIQGNALPVKHIYVQLFKNS